MKCPKCGIPILWGYPMPESMDDLMEPVERGKVVLGGCCVEEKKNCPRCGAHVFTTVEEGPLSLNPGDDA